MKKKVLESLKDFLQMYKIFFPFSFLFSIENEKKTFAPHFGGGCNAASPLKIWDVMTPYLKTLFEQKTEI